MSDERLLTADELAARWSVQKAHVYRLAREGRIPTVRVGRYYRFSPTAIAAWESEEGITPPRVNRQPHRDPNIARLGQTPKGYIYFVQAEGGGPIKIGHAFDVAKRLSELQIGAPQALQVIATTPGTRATEDEFHRRFADDRLHGEWFESTPRLRSFIIAAAQVWRRPL